MIGLLWETSLLDPEEVSILFINFYFWLKLRPFLLQKRPSNFFLFCEKRVLGLEDCQFLNTKKVLPAAVEGGKPIPEVHLWLLLTEKDKFKKFLNQQSGGYGIMHRTQWPCRDILTITKFNHSIHLLDLPACYRTKRDSFLLY